MAEDRENNPKQERLIRAVQLLKQAVLREFFGKIVFSIEGGNIVNVKEERSIKW